MDEDVYAELATAVRRLKKPLEELTKSHEQFVLSNMSEINNVKTVRDFRKGLEKAIAEDAKEKKKIKQEAGEGV